MDSEEYIKFRNREYTKRAEEGLFRVLTEMVNEGTLRPYILELVRYRNMLINLFVQFAELTKKPDETNVIELKEIRDTVSQIVGENKFDFSDINNFLDQKFGLKPGSAILIGKYADDILLHELEIQLGYNPDENS